MSLHLDIQPNKGLIIETLEGDLPLRDLEGVARRVWAHPRYEPNFDVLLDLSKANIKIRPSDMNALGDFFYNAFHPINGRVAIVATGFAETALNRMLQRDMRCRRLIAVFHTLESAGVYLGQPTLSTTTPAAPDP